MIKGLIRSARTGQRQVRDEKWNLDGVMALLSRLWELNASTEIDTSVARQKYITNQALDKHRRTPLCTRCAWDTGAHCRARFEIIWTKELAEAETASHAADSIPSGPDVMEIESLKSTGATGQSFAMEEVNTGQIVEREAETSGHLDQNATTITTKQSAGTQLTTNNVEVGIGGLRSVAGHQAERTDSMLPIEATKSSVNTMADVSHQYEHYTGKLWDRHKYIPK